MLLALSACGGDEGSGAATAPRVRGSGGSTGGATQTGGAAAAAIVRVHYNPPAGAELGLRGAGEGLSWDSSAPMVEVEAGVWEYRFETQSALVELKPVLEVGGDVTWPRGANFSNYVLPVGNTLDVYPFFFRETGQRRSFSVMHPEMGPRTVEVYLPPSYDEPGASAKEYPLIVLHDGQNLFDRNAFFGGWQIDASLDALLSTGRVVYGDDPTVVWEGGSVQETIVVGVHNAGAGRIYEYTPTNADGGGGADEYLDFLESVVIPETRSLYRVNGDRPSLGGSSLGGLVSLYAAWSRAERYDRAFVHSPSLWWDDAWMLDQIAAAPSSLPPLNVFIDAGTEDDGLANVLALKSSLEAHGYETPEDFQCLQGNGQGHDELAWRLRFPWAYYALFAHPQRAQPSWSLPAEVSPCP